MGNKHTNTTATPIAVTGKPRSNTARASQHSSAADLIAVDTPEGIKVTLRKGDITHEQVDAILSPSSSYRQMNQGGVSSAISKIGGKAIQDEYETIAPNGINFGDVVVTSGGRLKCQYVIHGACSPWGDGLDTCKQTLRTLMANTLREADKRKLTSLAFPALGTGVGQVPTHFVATVMMDEIQQFSSLCPHTTVRDIRVVFYNNDHIVQAFREVLNNRRAGLQKASDTVGDGTVIEATTTEEGVVVLFCVSEIAHQKVGAIVNAPGPELSLDNGAISQSLVAVGGSSLQAECSNNAPDGIGYGEVTLTSPGKLQCDYVIHGACSTWVKSNEETATKDLRNMVANSLMMAHETSMSSIAFPAIGTDNENFPPDVVVKAIMGEVTTFSQLYPDSDLKKVHLVLHPQDYPSINAFSEYLLGSSSNDLALKTPEGIVLSLNKSTMVDQQVDVIVNTPGRGLRLNLGTESSSLLKAAGKVLQDDCNQKAPNGIAFGETVTTSGGQLKCRVVVHGACCDWGKGPEMCTEVLRGVVSKSLMEAHTGNFRSVAFPAIGTDQRNFPPHLVATVTVEEVAKFSCVYKHTSVKDVRIVLDPQDHETIQAFEEVLRSCCEGFQKPVPHSASAAGSLQKPVPHSASAAASEDDLKPPSDLSEMLGSDTVRLENMTPGSSEYQNVKTLMLSTADDKVTRIHKIERIKNPGLYIKYMVDKQQMKARCGSSTTVERFLYHGTSEKAVAKINARGFDRGYCGKNGVVYGQGVYFAVKSGYSCDYAAATPDGKKQMYLAQVLTGEYTRGSKDYRVTPDNPDRPGFQFDSVVDNVSDPEIFVIFVDSQAYPKYLITFE